MTRGEAAGPRPNSKRTARSGPKASRATAAPRRTVAEPPTESRGRSTTLTARAAVLVVAVAAVMIALALPFKLWLGQRSDIASLQSQSQQEQRALDRLNAQGRRWQDPKYVESQARKRLHYTMPGQTTKVVLGRSAARGRSTPARSGTGSDLAWYSTFWTSVESAGASTTGK
ncbi:MAG TPA: septum formation initiator family protein [Mycobacteriales bacterium]|nr:septum formation initiator family protein [Mycobacteriales bacterium]